MPLLSVPETRLAPECRDEPPGARVAERMDQGQTRSRMLACRLVSPIAAFALIDTTPKHTGAHNT